MSLEAIAIDMRLTTVGKSKLADYLHLHGDDAKYPVRWIALGDANGTGYNPAPAQTTLRNEWGRFPVSPQSKRLSDGRVVFQFAVTGNGGRWVRELGVISADGTLFAVASDPLGPFWQKQTGITQALAQTVRFEGINPDNIGWVASGPDVNLLVDDELMDLSISQLDSHLRWMRQYDRDLKA